MRKPIVMTEETKKRFDKLREDQGRTVEGMMRHLIKQEEKNNNIHGGFRIKKDGCTFDGYPEVEYVAGDITPAAMINEHFIDSDIIYLNDFPDLARIIKSGGRITAEVAQNLSVIFSTTKKYWLNIQKNYDMRKINDEG